MPVRTIPLIVSVIVVLSGLGYAEELRTFTNTSGVQIEATVTGFPNPGKVTIQRKKDGREFTIPIDSLSDEDQDYLEKILEKTNADRTGFVTINTNRFHESQSSFGRHGRIKNRKYVDLVIPIGGWIFNGGPPVQYQGERKLEFTRNQDNSVTYLQRDEQIPRVVGLAPTENDAVPVFDPKELEEIVAVSGEGTGLRSLVEVIPDHVSIIVCANLDEEILELIKSRKTVGFCGSVNLDDLQVFQRLPLRLLSYEWNTSQRARPLILDFPELEQLMIKSGGSIDWKVGTTKLPQLKHFIKTRVSPSNNESVDFDFSQNPKLESFVSAENELVTRKAVDSLPSLSYLEMPSSWPLDSSVQRRLLKQEKLEYLELRSFDVTTATLDRWLNSGNLKRLKLFDAAAYPTEAQCPHLRVFDSSRAKPKSESISSLPGGIVEAILDDLGDEEIESLTRLKDLRTLKLTSCSLGQADLDRLPTIKNLILEAVEFRGGALSIDRMPQLEGLQLEEIKKLQSLKGINGHSSISSLTISGLEDLTLVEEIEGASKLESVFLSDLPALSTTDAFKKVTTIQNLTIVRCKKISSVETLLKNSKPTRVEISGCPLVGDVRIFPRN